MTDQQNLANAIRALSMDAVQKAGCGHPGMPMGMADIAQVLWSKHLKYNPSNPNWFDRDRFVLSNGHGSMLLYSLLHLTGYDLSMDEIKNFRQLGSKTPGHPECDVTPGVETTTGPLGQGIANAVGMAMAEQLTLAVEQATGEAIDRALTEELGAAIDAEIARAFNDPTEEIDGDVLGFFILISIGSLAKALPVCLMFAPCRFSILYITVRSIGCTCFKCTYD